MYLNSNQFDYNIFWSWVTSQYQSSNRYKNHLHLQLYDLDSLFMFWGLLVILHFLYFCHSLGHIWNILGPILGVFIILIFGIAVYCKKKSKGVVFRKSEIPHSRLVNEPVGAFECFLIYFHVFQKKSCQCHY